MADNEATAKLRAEIERAKALRLHYLAEAERAVAECRHNLEDATARRDWWTRCAPFEVLEFEAEKLRHEKQRLRHEKQRKEDEADQRVQDRAAKEAAERRIRSGVGGAVGTVLFVLSLLAAIVTPFFATAREVGMLVAGIALSMVVALVLTFG